MNHVNMTAALMLSAFAARLSVNENKGSATVGERIAKLAHACDAYALEWADGYESALRRKNRTRLELAAYLELATEAGFLKKAFNEVEKIAESLGMKAWVGDGERDLFVGTDGYSVRMVETWAIGHRISMALRKETGS